MAAENLTQAQLDRITRLLESMMRQENNTYYTKDALRVFYASYGERLKRAMQQGNVDQVLSAWERGFPRFGVTLVTESRATASLGVTARVINEGSMDRIIAECKRAKDDML